ncbi:MAG: GNAT family N-acetyltransferase [Gemmatimonadaceae bacterium]
MPDALPRMLDVTRTYLELRTPAQFRDAISSDAALRVDRAADCPVSFFRYLYREVGARYRWRDRLSWTDDACHAHLARANISIWVLYLAGSPAGWFELRMHDDRSAEIAYFGLLREFIGRGLGKHLLTVAARTAWSLEPTRVWLHTCTLDDPAALPNYRARGFTEYKTERYTVPE